MLKITDHLVHYVSQEDIEALLADYKEENGDRVLDGFVHEFIDRTHVITNTIERELALHPAILYSAEAQALLSQALSTLYDLYQVAGAITSTWRTPKHDGESIEGYDGQTVIVKSIWTGDTSLAILVIIDGEVQALELRKGQPIYHECDFTWCFAEEI